MSILFADTDLVGMATLVGVIFGGVIGLVGAVTTSLITLLKWRADERQAAAVAAKVDEAAEKADKIAAKVEQVAVQSKKDLAHVRTVLEDATALTTESLASIAGVVREARQTGEATHLLVNSAMQEQKRIYAAKCREAATDNPTAANVAEAEEAEQAYQDYKDKQERLDAKE